MVLLPSLQDTLVATADALADARDPWWVISGAAAAIHGVTPIDVRDVDVLLSPADARRILPALGLQVKPGLPDERFQSDIFATWGQNALPVEFMAGFRQRLHSDWIPVRPATRRAFDLGSATLYVPERTELIQLFFNFGREKDLERARLLTSLP